MCCINRRTASRILFLIALSLFMLQLYWGYSIYQIEQLTETYFVLYRRLYTVLFSISFFSFLQTAFTDPGFITDSNNAHFIALYRVTRVSCMARARMYNEQTKRRIHLVDEGYESQTDCELDEQSFPMLNNNDKIAEQYRKDFNMNTRLCPKCHIIRVPNVHHCPDCHQCVYMIDHHCVWLNTCIGQFNQKFFVLFCFYFLLTSLIGLGMNIKYIFMVDLLRMLDSFLLGLSIFSSAFFHFAFILFTIKLLVDQYENLEDMSFYFDNKKSEMVEIRSKMEVMCEIFGSGFSLWWFIPLTRGGLYQVMNEIKKIE